MAAQVAHQTVRSADGPLPALEWGGTLGVRLGLVLANDLAVITYYIAYMHTLHLRRPGG